MHRPILRTLPFVIALAFGSGWATAQTANSSATANGGNNTAHATAKSGGDKKLSHGDKSFIEDAAKGGMAEVEAGKLAQQKGSDPAVKELGQRLVQDHGKANDELKQIADAKGVAMPDKEKWMDRHEGNKLQKLSGDKFDREFAQHEVKDHEKDIKKFEKAASKLDDPDLKAWAQKQLPVLREHLAMAQKAAGDNGNKNAAADKSDTKAAGAKGSKS